LATGEATRDLIIDTILATDGAGLGAGGAGLGAALGAGGAGLGAALGAGGAGLGAGGAGLGAGGGDALRENNFFIEIRSFLFPSCSSLISLSSLLFEESIFSFSNNFLFSTIAKCG
jgi:hypothetical protein